MNGMLDGLTALDLTDEKGCLCGSILATLGIRIIKVEKPGGSPERNIGPFSSNGPIRESLFWLAYNADKLGITLSIETPEGRRLFKKLVEKADFVIESFAPGYLDGLNLGYESLSKINPRIIVTSITHFGQTGPYRDFKGSDIVDQALGGYLFLTGDPDRPPLRVSQPQAFLHGALEATVATLIANSHRELTGVGQHVDVSIQESLVKLTDNTIPCWDLNGEILPRAGRQRVGRVARTSVTQLWRCKDGYLDFLLGGGPTYVKSNAALAAWLEKVGTDEFIKHLDWDKLDMARISQDTLQHLERCIGEAFASHTKAEIFGEALKSGIELLPAWTVAEIAQNDQLKSRQFFSEVEYSDNPRLKLRWPGTFIKSSECQLNNGHHAPSVGEHNRQVYGELLGLTERTLRSLSAKEVI